MLVHLVLLIAWFLHTGIANTITETSSVFSKQIICNEFEDCWINCEGYESCYMATIICPQTSYAECHLSCTGQGSCAWLTLVSISASYLTINCNGPHGNYGNYDGSGFPTCYYMHINATASELYSDSSYAKITCDSDLDLQSTVRDACGGSTLALTNFKSLTLECSTTAGCWKIKLFSYMNDDVDINCNHNESCIYATMYINDSDTVSINVPTDTTNALREATIYIDGVTDKLEQINCAGTDTCYDSDFTFKNIQNDVVSLYCSNHSTVHHRYGSCRSVDIYLDSSYKFNLICEGYGCVGMDIYGDCYSAKIQCDNCHQDQITLFCENSDNAFVYPPSKSPTTSPTHAPPPTISNPEQNESTSFNLIGFTLSIIFLTTLLVVISFNTFNKYTQNNRNAKNEEFESKPKMEQHIGLTVSNVNMDIDSKEEEKYDIEPIATIKSKHNLKKQLLPIQLQSVASQVQCTAWCNDVIIRKNCYLELLPHLIDHAFVIAVILKFYDIKQWNMLIYSVVIVLIYRVISSIQMFYYTKSKKQTMLQLFDLELYEALIVNYKGDQSDNFEPCSPQKWISLMEAAFQAVPMSVLLLTYLISNGYVLSEYVIIIQLAVVWCLNGVIVIRNMNEDEVCFKNAVTQRLEARLRENQVTEIMQLPRKYPWMLLLRFCDSICRIYCVSLIAAANIFAFLIMITIEFIGLLIYGRMCNEFCIIDYTNNISSAVYHMFIRCDVTNILLTAQRVLYNFLMLGLAYFFDGFSGYLPYIIGVINICFMYIMWKYFYSPVSWYIEKHATYFNTTDIFNQSRSIDHLIHKRAWRDILDFIEFGFVINTAILLRKHPKLLESAGEDLEEAGAKPFLKFLMSSTNLSAKHYNDMYIGGLQAYENKNSLDEHDYKEPIELLQHLIGNTNVNLSIQTSRHKRTILHLCCLKKHHYLLDLILNELKNDIRVINPNLFDRNGESPLHVLCKGKPNISELESRNCILQKLFSFENINVNIRSTMNSNETPLHYAIRYNDYSLVKQFISNNGIDLTDNIKGTNNENYLHYSARNNGPDENIVFMIFNNNKYEYNVNTQELNGNTVLHLSYEKPNFVEKLLECAEIDVNISNNKGVVPIVNAIQYKNNNFVFHQLIEHYSLDINAIDNNGDSVLHYAIKTAKNINNCEHVSLVLNHPQIDVNRRNSKNVGGYSALHECYLKNIPLMHVKLLLNHKLINRNIKSLSNGDTPLHFAIQLGHWNSSSMGNLETLLNHPNMRSKNIANNQGKTPVNMAKTQVNKVTSALETARNDLLQRAKDLTRAQVKYQQEANIYQQRLIEYQAEKHRYDMEYSNYQMRLTQYDSLPQEIKNRSTKPTAPSTSKPTAPSTSSMESAQSNVESCQCSVESARDDVSRYEFRLDISQNIINKLARY